MQEGVSYRVDGAVARIVLDAPDADHRLTDIVLTRLLGFARELAANASVSVVVITGAGRACFSTGLLTPQIKAAMSKDGVLALVRLANEVCDAYEALPQLVIAGINGRIRAGAVELALACDIRVCADHATLAMPEAKWGGFPGAGGPVRLPALVGRARALDLICSGREIDAAEMERIGLVQRVIARDRFDAELDEMVQTIAANGPLAIRGAKRVVGVRTEPGFRAAREVSDALRNAFEWTGDADEGVAAHLEGRAPRFSGR
jgi:enoyl-CoA hydratase/carnithine racemase